MKQAASHLGTRRVLRALALIRQESLAVELLAKEKNVLFSGQIFFLLGQGNGLGFILKIISLVLIRKFQTDCFKVLFLGEAETAGRLVIKFWFGDVAWQK